jgi:hypothetical protein
MQKQMLGPLDETLLVIVKRGKMLNFGPFSPTTKESVHSFIKSTISWRYQQGSTAL